jgi:hypothetical protein
MSNPHGITVFGAPGSGAPVSGRRTGEVAVAFWGDCDYNNAKNKYEVRYVIKSRILL